MDELKEIIKNSSISTCIRGNILNYAQNELSFPICLNFASKDEVLDVKIIKSNYNVQIRIKPVSLDFVNKVVECPWIVNHVNSRLVLGIFKYKSLRKLLFYSYSYDLVYYCSKFVDYFINLLAKLMNVFISEIYLIQKIQVFKIQY